jgi:uncharacterized iron-regulated membrane protein
VVVAVVVCADAVAGVILLWPGSSSAPAAPPRTRSRPPRRSAWMPHRMRDTWPW